MLKNLLNRFYKNKRENYILIAGLGVLLLVFFVIHLPLQKRREQLIIQTEYLHTQARMLKVYDVSEEKFKDLLQQRLDRMAEMRQVLPKKATESLQIDNLSGLIKSAGMQLYSIKNGRESISKSGYVERILECRVKGDYFSLLKLLNNFEKKEPSTIVKIKTINVEQDGKISVNMNLSLFSLP